MLPNHHLLSQIPLRVDSLTRRLQGAIWLDAVALKIEVTEAGPDLLSWNQARKLPCRDVETPSFWGRLFDQRWCRIVFPKKAGRDQWLNWKDQGEATLYVGGKPYFGFDVAHRYCRLPAGLSEVWVEANCVQSAIWHPDSSGLSAQGSLFEGAFLVRRDDDAWHAWHDMKCLLDAALCLRQQENVALQPTVAPGHTQAAVEKHSPAFRRMLRWLDDGATAAEAHGPAACRKVMAKAYAELRADRSLMEAVLTGHAHIDLVWLWPERISELKAVHTFSTVNRLMDEYPDFRFAYSQPASYEAVQRRAPGLYDTVKRRIRSGRWEATGALYVESDTLMPCGEALLRSFLVGQEEFVKIQGKRATLTWLPDVFGYSACIPQMIRLAGSEYFFTTKMTWNLVNRFPYSSFVWRGHDGSEVVAHVTQDCGYNASLEASELKNSSWGHQQGDVHREYLLPTGYGDGGGGPSAEMCERARRLGGLPGMPAVRWDQPENFFARLAPLKDKLPVLKGECYVEGHRGTLTTQADVKAAFRGLERALQISEAASCVTGKDWDRLRVWKRLIFAQFHDYIPGSSVWDVYLEGVPELKSLAEEQMAKSTRALGPGRGDACVFNPHGVEVTRWVRHPKTKKTVRVRVPALSGTLIESARVAGEARVLAEGLRVSNGLCDFRLNKKGWIESLSLGGQKTALAGAAGQLISYCDKPSRFEAWDLDRHTLAMGTVCDEKAEIEPFAEGAHRAGYRVRRKVAGASIATVEFTLEAGSPLLHVTVDVDLQDPYTLLKFFVPTQHLATNARYGVPYGSVLRPQVVNGPVSEAMWEVPFSRWMAVFDERESEGLFAVSEAKYGVSVRDGAVGISLVRSPKAVGHDSHRGSWPPHLSRVKGPSPHTDLGRHIIRLALGRYHPGLSRAEHPASLADTLFTDPMPYIGAAYLSPLQALEGGETLVPAWAQPLGKDAWLLRLHEVAGQRGEVVVKLASPWKAASCDALGNTNGDLKSVARVPFGPYQIVSVRIGKGKS